MGVVDFLLDATVKLPEVVFQQESEIIAIKRGE